MKIEGITPFDIGGILASWGDFPQNWGMTIIESIQGAFGRTLNIYRQLGIMTLMYYVRTLNDAVLH